MNEPLLNVAPIIEAAVEKASTPKALNISFPNFTINCNNILIKKPAIDINILIRHTRQKSFFTTLPMRDMLRWMAPKPRCSNTTACGMKLNKTQHRKAKAMPGKIHITSPTIAPIAIPIPVTMLIPKSTKKRVPTAL